MVLLRIEEDEDKKKSCEAFNEWIDDGNTLRTGVAPSLSQKKGENRNEL